MTDEAHPQDAARRKESPETVALRARPRPVVRLNRRVLVAVVGVLSGSALILTVWTLSHSRSSGFVPADPRNFEHVARAEGFEKLPKDYSQVPQLGAPIGEFGRPLLKTERNLGLSPLPETPNFAPNHVDDADRAARLAEQQEAQEAAKSRIFFALRQTSAVAAKEIKPGTDDAADSHANVGSRAGVNSNAEAKSDQSRKQAFLDEPSDRRIYASSTLVSPRSANEVMAGTVISAALMTGIDSDLPGQIIASVTQNVFDTVTGRRLLIPQGSRLLGRYDSQVAFGQRRVQMIWTRLLMPDGTSVQLDQLPGSDGAGRSGLEDRVNWHWGRVFAGAALSTLIGVGAELAAPDRAQGEILVATRDSVQQNVNEVGQQITRRSLDVQPTLTIRAGLPVTVIVNKDLILKPYASVTIEDTAS